MKITKLIHSHPSKVSRPVRKSTEKLYNIPALEFSINLITRSISRNLHLIDKLHFLCPRYEYQQCAWHGTVSRHQPHLSFSKPWEMRPHFYPSEKTHKAIPERLRLNDYSFLSTTFSDLRHDTTQKFLSSSFTMHAYTVMELIITPYK